MGNAARILPNYTYSDYLHWEGRWELIEGIPFAMSPMASPRHQKIASELNFEFSKLLKEGNCQCSVYQPIDVKINENTVVQPDLLIICKPIEKQYLDFAPCLVVEIISPSSRLKDKITKFELYQNFGIKYYVLIDLDDDSVTAYQLNNEGKYIQMENPLQFDIQVDCKIEPTFSEIW